MNYLASDDIIITCSSGALSNVAISIIRVTGFDDITIFQKYFNFPLSKVKKRYSHFTKLVNLTGEFIDEILFTFFPAPNSFTGENVLELSVHGNMLNVNRIIQMFKADLNFRDAGPGEFSYRALRNKKLSLTQVEGLDLFLNARNSYALTQGQSLLGGLLKQDYENLYQAFLAHKSAIEFSTDFYEDMGEENASRLFKETLDNFYHCVSVLYQRLQSSTSDLISPSISLIGPPNAGKSTLFNKFIGRERAIVTSVAGTTRDYLAEDVLIHNNIYKLIDTAGLRATEDVVENIGIEHTKSFAESSFYKILVINPFQISFDYLDQFIDFDFDMVVYTHLDQADFTKQQSYVCTHKLLASCSSVNYDLTKACDLNTIFSLVNNKYLRAIQSQPITVERHRSVISDIYKLSTQYNNICLSESDISILSHEFNTIGHCISELIGIVSPDNVLHNIFDNFCIGK
jgi:tRNA modification GTPase